MPVLCSHKDLYRVLFLIMGPYTLHSSSTYASTIAASADVAALVPKVLAGLGAVLIVLGILGHCGITTGSTILLNAFVLISITVLCLQIAIGILAMRQFRSMDDGLDAVNKGFRSSIKLYGKSNTVTRSIDHTQENLHCCGAEGKGDWDQLPKSCCQKYVSGECKVYYENGCGKALFTFLQSKMRTSSGFAYGATFFQLFGIVAAYLFIISG
ncbi:CD63 antigen-like isoform X2 [Photinus pyralis]|uniref:CD63 antigen-like isoform X2 n=1 Tax=Photinus pyralis TaxID=7054 RepID=UPI001267371F|nr:CD63 antigen-like isoform X2 [Photinus pyralis]